MRLWRRGGKIGIKKKVSLTGTRSIRSQAVRDGEVTFDNSRGTENASQGWSGIFKEERETLT